MDHDAERRPSCDEQVQVGWIGATTRTVAEVLAAEAVASSRPAPCMRLHRG